MWRPEREEHVLPVVDRRWLALHDVVPVRRSAARRVREAVERRVRPTCTASRDEPHDEIDREHLHVARVEPARPEERGPVRSVATHRVGAASEEIHRGSREEANEVLRHARRERGRAVEVEADLEAAGRDMRERVEPTELEEEELARQREELDDESVCIVGRAWPRDERVFAIEADGNEVLRRDRERLVPCGHRDRSAVSAQPEVDVGGGRELAMQVEAEPLLGEDRGLSAGRHLEGERECGAGGRRLDEPLLDEGEGKEIHRHRRPERARGPVDGTRGKRRSARQRDASTQARARRRELDDRAGGKRTEELRREDRNEMRDHLRHRIVDALSHARGEEGEAFEQALDVRVRSALGEHAGESRMRLREGSTHVAEVRELALVVLVERPSHATSIRPPGRKSVENRSARRSSVTSLAVISKRSRQPGSCWPPGRTRTCERRGS